MTRRLTFPAALATALVLGQGAHAAPAAEAAAPRELAVCSDPANLPYSNERGEGFENRLATLIADELHATLHYTWNLQRRSFLPRTLQAGACDLVMGVPGGLPGVLASRPYYTSTYVFVAARDRGLRFTGFDDPALRGWRIGLQALGAEGANTPPAAALARRGLSAQVVGFEPWGSESDETPQSHIVEAVRHGEIDAAIVWGPIAGYYARPWAAQLALTPVAGDALQPGLAFQYPMSVGVRRGDAALLAEVQAVLDRRQPEIQALLQSYGIPLVTAAVPLAGTSTREN